MRFVSTWLARGFVVAMAALALGCGGSDGGSDVGGSGGEGGGGGSGANAAPLTFFEQELVSKWSRYHSYDGSTDYMIFRADRTGCKFEYSSSSSRTDNDNITYWALEDQGNNIFRLRLKGPNISSEPLGYLSSHEYHYLTDEIWRGGYENLRMHHSTTSRDCE